MEGKFELDAARDVYSKIVEELTMSKLGGGPGENNLVKAL